MNQYTPKERMLLEKNQQNRNSFVEATEKLGE